MLDLLQRRPEASRVKDLREKVENYVHSCLECARAKSSRKKTHGTLCPLPIPEGPWQEISMDFIVELPESADPGEPGGTTYDSIWVVVDRFTKWAHFLPYRENWDAEVLARRFIKHVFAYHGAPRSIVSDRGSTFIARFTQAVCKVLGMEQSFSMAYHPQTDGQTERTNQTLEQYLRIYCNYAQNDWVSLLPVASFAYNNGKSTSTGQSPFYANYGYHPKLAIDLEEADRVPTAQDCLQNLKKAHETAKKRLEEARRTQAKYYDQKRQEAPEFGEGELVWLQRRHIRTQRPCDKLDDKKLGPFKILQKIGTHARRLELPPTMQIHDVLHVSLLEPYRGDPSNPAIRRPGPVIVK